MNSQIYVPRCKFTPTEATLEDLTTSVERMKRIGGLCYAKMRVTLMEEDDIRLKPVCNFTLDYIPVDIVAMKQSNIYTIHLTAVHQDYPIIHYVKGKKYYFQTTSLGIFDNQTDKMIYHEANSVFANEEKTIRIEKDEINQHNYLNHPIYFEVALVYYKRDVEKDILIVKDWKLYQDMFNFSVE